MEDPHKGAPPNYRLITCLSITRKLLSGIIAAKMNRYMSQYISKAQKGVANNTRRSKHLSQESNHPKLDRPTWALPGWTTRKLKSQRLAWILGCVLQRQQCTDNLNQELNVAAGKKFGSQLQGCCTNQHQVWDIQRWCTVPSAALCRSQATQPISQNVDVESGSEVEWPSATSYTWTISNCRVGVNRTLTHWSAWQGSTVKTRIWQCKTYHGAGGIIHHVVIHKTIYLFIGLFTCF